MAYVPTPSHGAPVGVAKATVHIFLNAMGRVTVTLVRPKEQFHTPHCLLADNNISNGVKHIRCRTGYKRYRVTCEAINRGMITTIASRNSYSEWLLNK